MARGVRRRTAGRDVAPGCNSAARPLRQGLASPIERAFPRLLPLRRFLRHLRDGGGSSAASCSRVFALTVTPGVDVGLRDSLPLPHRSGGRHPWGRDQACARHAQGSLPRRSRVATSARWLQRRGPAFLCSESKARGQWAGGSSADHTPCLCGADPAGLAIRTRRPRAVVGRSCGGFLCNTTRPSSS